MYGIDLNPIALETLGNYGAKAVASDANLFAHELDAVLLLVINAKQVKSILFDSGLAANLKPGTAIMVSATISAQDAKDIEAGLQVLPSADVRRPRFRWCNKAEAGDEDHHGIPGSIEAFTKLAPVLAATAGKVYNIGTEIGLGAIRQNHSPTLAGVHIAAGAEAMALAARANIPLI
ncbi:NAD(P)-binding domain-containing protein [Vibrio metschnikovii]